MTGRVNLINGKGDWTDVPPTGADDHDLQKWAVDFITNAGVVNLSGGDLLVTQLGSPGMAVQVAGGRVYVLNSSWTANSLAPKFYSVTRDAAEASITIGSNSSGSTRLDLICQKIDKVTTPNDTATNVCPILVVAGTPGAGQPATPATHELLAVVTVASGAGSITNANITDSRRQVGLKDQPGIVTLTDGATPALDASLGTIFLLTAAGNRTIGIPTNPIDGQKIVIRHKASGADRTLALNTGTGGFRFGTDLTGLTATTSAKTDYIGCIYNKADNKWDVLAYTKGF